MDPLLFFDWEFGFLDCGPMPFRFENKWFIRCDFKDKVGCWSNKCQITGWKGHN